jgi:hypothetical protein
MTFFGTWLEFLGNNRSIRINGKELGFPFKYLILKEILANTT